MPKWVVGTIDEIPPGQRKIVDVAGRTIGVFNVGGELFASSFARLRPLGTVIAIGSVGGAWGEIEPARLIGRNVGLVGFYLGRLMRLEPGLVHEALGELLDLWQTGAFSPLVGAELQLDDVEQAHELVQSRRSVGKVVLLP